jgi:hypothetical protein
MTSQLKLIDCPERSEKAIKASACSMIRQDEHAMEVIARIHGFQGDLRDISAAVKNYCNAKTDSARNFLNNRFSEIYAKHEREKDLMLGELRELREAA